MVVKQQKTAGGTTNCFTELKYWEKQGEKEGEGAHLDSVLHLLHDHSTYHHLSISMN
jgi:hypothetical protein